MELFYMLLYVVAGVFIGLAAGGIRSGRLHFGWLGLFVLVCVEFLKSFQKI